MGRERLRRERIGVGVPIDTSLLRAGPEQVCRARRRLERIRSKVQRVRNHDAGRRGTGDEQPPAPQPLSSLPSLLSFSAQRRDMTGHSRVRCYSKFTLWTLPFSFKYTH